VVAPQQRPVAESGPYPTGGLPLSEIRLGFNSYEIEFGTMAARRFNRNGPAVKRVLRHKDSHEYFKEGSWTTNPNEADSFADSVEVAETCSRYQLTDVELALRFEAGCEIFCTSIR
jgi:hypothetical protein